MGTNNREAFARAATLVGQGRLVEWAIGTLPPVGDREMAMVAADTIEAAVGRLWEHGWQPVDVVGTVNKHLGKGEGSVLRATMAADAAHYELLGNRVAPHWMAQLRTAKARRTWIDSEPYLLQLGVPWSEVLPVALRLAGLLLGLPPLTVLTPPPSEWSDDMAVAPPADLPDGLLEKVRALLAKAESTDFEAEADAFTAKAQELMARHRIDRAMVSASAGPGAEGDAPHGRRLAIDDPYADTKATLLSTVARVNGGRVVWSKALGHATVMAFPDDLVVIDELFTSLLVQANAAMRRAGSRTDRRGRSRTRSFRRSFLTAFAVRIGERLDEAVADVVRDESAERHADVLPVLARRDDAVEAAVEQAFPEVRAFRPRVSDAEGWIAGTVAADQADLGVGPAIEARS